MRQPEYQEGNYTAKVVDQAFTETKEHHKPMIVLKVRIEKMLVDAGTKFEGLEDVANHYERSIFLVVNHENPKAMEFLLKKLRYAGFESPSFRDFNLVGETVRCTCTHDLTKEYPEDWDLMLPPRESIPLVHDPKLSKKMDALFGKSLKDSVATVAQEPASDAETHYAEEQAAQAEQVTPPPDSEIPF